MKVMIIGGGKVGTYLAEKLLAEKHDVRLIEIREEERAHILLDIPSEALYIGNGTDRYAEAANPQRGCGRGGYEMTNQSCRHLAGSFLLLISRDRASTIPKTPGSLMGYNDVAINRPICSRYQEEMSMGDMVSCSC